MSAAGASAPESSTSSDAATGTASDTPSTATFADAIDPSASAGNTALALTGAASAATLTSATSAASARDQTGALRDPTSPAQSAASVTATPDVSASTALAMLHVGALAHSVQTLEPTSQRELTAPVGTASWNDELGGHLTLMAQQGNQSASLQLTPPDLGPIEVRIAVHDSQASVWFGAVHPDTRDALQQALPRLRELFAAQGLALADAGVFREPPRQQPQPLPSSSTPLDSTPNATSAAPVARARIGLIDTYA